MTSWQATLATAPRRGVDAWVAWVGGPCGRQQALRWRWNSHWASLVTPCFLGLPFPPLALMPLSCSQHYLFWTGEEREGGFLHCFLHLFLPHGHTCPLAVFDVTESQFQPGCLSNTAKHTRCPLDSNFATWKTFKDLNVFFTPTPSLTTWSTGENQNHLSPSHLPAPAVCPGAGAAPSLSPALLLLLPVPMPAEFKTALSTDVSFDVTSYRCFGAKSNVTMAL